MKRKVLTITTITITVLVLLFLPPLLVILFELGTKIDKNTHMDSYKDYYIYRIDYVSHGIFESSAYTSLWFLPSQKEQLLNKIKEDVSEILIDIQAQMSKDNITMDYEISDDFKDVTIYIDDYGTYMQMSHWAESDVIDSEYLKSEIGMRVTLYHDLIQNSHEPDYGNVNVPYWGDVVNLVYNGSEADKEQWFREQEEKEREKLGYLIPGDHP